MSTYYKDIQIVKHALQFYINRTNADEKDLEREKRLLKKLKKKLMNIKKEKTLNKGVK